MRRDDDRYTIPASAARLSEAVCGDYYRRATAIRSGIVSGAALDVCMHLNIAVETALEGLENGVRSEMLKDVALGRGYNKSNLGAFMAKNTYYDRRRKLIYDIAKGLNLV